MDLPSYAVGGFDAEAFDDAIRDNGVTYQHFRSMRCPVGLSSIEDVRRTHDDHQGCQNGFIYTLAGEVTVLSTGNSKDSKFADPGRMDGSSMRATFPRFYDRCRPEEPEVPVRLAPFDRLFLKEDVGTVETWQLFAASGQAQDRLMFPAVCVHDLMDSRGIRYAQGADFDVAQGRVAWHPGRSPGVDPKTRLGTVLAIRYSYVPFWYVDRLEHEIRVTQRTNEISGEREVIRMPQSAQLVREHVFRGEDADPLAKNPTSARQVPEPIKGGPTSSGGFGPG